MKASDPSVYNLQVAIHKQTPKETNGEDSVENHFTNFNVWDEILKCTTDTEVIEFTSLPNRPNSVVCILAITSPHASMPLSVCNTPKGTMLFNMNMRRRIPLKLSQIVGVCFVGTPRSGKDHTNGSHKSDLPQPKLLKATQQNLRVIRVPYNHLDIIIFYCSKPRHTRKVSRNDINEYVRYMYLESGITLAIPTCK